MRYRIMSAIVVGLALLAPGIASAHASQPSSAAALPTGSRWGIGGGAPDCSTVSEPPAAPAGAVPVLVGRLGQPATWCWGSWARVAADGAVLLSGGVPGERLSPAAYARQTGQTVTVVTQPDGQEAVYLS